MKILVIGDANSVFVYNYIRCVLIPKNDEIYLTCEETSNINYLEFYNQHNVKLVELAPNIPTFITKIPKVRGLVNILTANKNLHNCLETIGKFDVIHLHGMWNRTCFICKDIYKYTNTLVCSYWGSDLFRTPNEGKGARICLENAKYITISTQAMLNKFIEIFGHQFDNKIKNVKFGVNGFDSIDEVSKTEAEQSCKKYFGIEPDRTVISIGYNAKREQQHLKVINELKKLPESLLSKITIILQMTYGLPNPDSYFAEIEAKLKIMPCKYKILKDFMCNDDIARLRLATNIFIHAQTTDAFSSSIQEYLYAGKVVINPKWINYGELKSNNVSYIEYEDFSELSSLVLGILKDKNVNLSENKNILRNMSSWDSVKNTWYELYK